MIYRYRVNEERRRKNWIYNVFPQAHAKGRAG